MIPAKEDIVITEARLQPFIPRETGQMCLSIKWTGNVGCGEYILYKGDDGKWKGNSGFMDNEEDKYFLRLLLKKIADDVDILE